MISYASGVQQATAHRYSFDITDLAQQWVDGTADASLGIIFRSTDAVENSEEYFYKTFATSERASYKPTFKIIYRDRLTYYEKVALLLSHCGNATFNSFAAEVEFHADSLYDPKADNHASDWYKNVLRSEMSISSKHEPNITHLYQDFYKLDSDIVQAQIAIHGEY